MAAMRLEARSGGDGKRQRTMAARCGKRVNVFPASVLSAGYTGRLRVLRETHLEAWGVAKATGDGGWRRGNAGEQLVSTGKQGRGEEVAGEHPHRNVKLLECWLEGGERQRGERPRHDGNGSGGSFGR
jgi:hypothetical protein